MDVFPKKIDGFSVRYSPLRARANSLKKVGVTDELAKKIVVKVQAKLSKMDPPISTRLIKAVVMEELEKEKPEAAKKLRNRKLWDLKSF